MSDVTISEMHQALSQLGVISRAIAGAEKLISGLANVEQVGRELDAAIAKKRETLALDCQAEIDDAKRRGQNEWHKIVIAGKEEAARILGAAKDEAAAIGAEVKAKQAELDKLSGHVDDLRGKLKSALA